jgi:hypothetical protein
VPVSAPVVAASRSISPSDIYLMLADAFRFIKVYWERTVYGSNVTFGAGKLLVRRFGVQTLKMWAMGSSEVNEISLIVSGCACLPVLQLRSLINKRLRI